MKTWRSRSRMEIFHFYLRGRRRVSSLFWQCIINYDINGCSSFLNAREPLLVDYVSRFQANRSHASQLYRVPQRLNWRASLKRQGRCNEIIRYGCVSRQTFIFMHKYMQNIDITSPMCCPPECDFTHCNTGTVCTYVPSWFPILINAACNVTR